MSSYSTFLDSEYLRQIFLEITTENVTDKTKIALIYTILAAGCQLHWAQGAERDINKGRNGAGVLFSKAIECSEAISETASTTAFQALLSMVGAFNYFETLNTNMW